MIAAYEAEMNVVIHAESAAASRPPSSDGQLDVDVIDEGPGIPDVAAAMTRGLVDRLARGPRAGLRRRHGPAQHPPQLRPPSRSTTDARQGHTVQLHRAAAPRDADRGARPSSLAVIAELCRTAATASWPARRPPSACATACRQVLDHLCIDCTCCIARLRRRRPEPRRRRRPTPRASAPCAGRAAGASSPASASTSPPTACATRSPSPASPRSARSHGYEAALRAAGHRRRRRRRARRARCISPVCPAVVDLIELRVPVADRPPGAVRLALGVAGRRPGRRATPSTSCRARASAARWPPAASTPRSATPSSPPCCATSCCRAWPRASRRDAVGAHRHGRDRRRRRCA